MLESTAVAEGDTEIIGEAANLLFHVLVLLQSKGLSLGEVAAELERRHRS
jgi:phosphoribosyl-ATP pyrophosphohydrolase